MKIKIPLEKVEELKQALRENKTFEIEEGLGMMGDMNHIHFKSPKNKGLRRAFDYYVVAELYKFFWNEEYVCMLYLTGKYLNAEDKEFLLNLLNKYSGGKE